MTVISLLTDFGMDDDEAMLLKGVIYKIAPHVRCVDLTHAIPAQNIQRGAEVIGNCFHYFPQGSIHVAVVDPGVGTKRRGMAAHIGSYYFVGPDNGLFTRAYEYAEEHGWNSQIVSLTNPNYFLAEVNPIFHGRDIFAPVAAHLANGVELSAFGEPFMDPIRLE
jgi:S-adenosyl-L-methionine hydrolase (adenosine-forming)